jgi:hypothetical protein
MSVDIEIIPTKTIELTWQNIRSEIDASNYRDIEIVRPTGNATLIDINRNAPIGDDDVLAKRCFYGLQQDTDSCISIWITENSDSETDEQLYLEDFGHNLEPNFRHQIARSWKAVGVSYEVLGRLQMDPMRAHLQIAVVVAIARLCEGHIILKDDGLFGHVRGTYSVESFLEAIVVDPRVRPANPWPS